MELWIARTSKKNSTISIYKRKPTKANNRFVYVGDDSFNLPKSMENLFQELTFENSPQKIELNIIR